MAVVELDPQQIVARATSFDQYWASFHRDRRAHHRRGPFVWVASCRALSLPSARPCLCAHDMTRLRETFWHCHLVYYRYFW